MKNNSPGLSISPAEVHENRFLLYGITFLLSTPSDFADIVEQKTDLDMWLKNAGVDPDQAYSRRRNICAEYVNQVTQHPTAYALMNQMHCALRTMRLDVAAMYVGKDCPTAIDSAAIFGAMVQLGQPSAPQAPTNGAN
ncbi:MAG TPA: hypothetical protein VN679_03375 [Candidatus Acidoferrales bacterium]|nr:hypothetical protein [Candidatus Angelobacter sp.]HWG86799.1 hypothetical protein [Candidatus Acidoferrales bacterium]